MLKGDINLKICIKKESRLNDQLKNISNRTVGFNSIIEREE